MSCTNCATGKNGIPKGCKNNGTCGKDSCNKLTVFDWLSNMALPGGQEVFDCVEVRFKNSRKEFYRTPRGITFQIGDIVATEATSGHDVGIVTLTGELVKVQMRKKKIDWNDSSLLKIYRKATKKDTDTWINARNSEASIQKHARELAIFLKLEMKISDVEFQGDGTRATFYYTAEGRVDFRQLIKDMAKAFNIKIEMRQIGYRYEASRLGGIGSCGRELCCTTWLTDFRSVNTAAARYQQLAINPQKLAGQCGKLKCCLNYELDMYMEALQKFPSQEVFLDTEKGRATCQKTDIFNERMWYAYLDNPMQWYPIPIQEVQQILQLNRTGKKIASLEEYAPESAKDKKTDSESLTRDSITRFDVPDHNRRKGRNRKKKPRKKSSDNA